MTEKRIPLMCTHFFVSTKIDSETQCIYCGLKREVNVAEFFTDDDKKRIPNNDYMESL